MKEVTIDCRDLLSRSDLHSIFVQALSCPEWYGNNLDALHDQLTSLCSPTHICMIHWADAEAALGRYAVGAKRAILDSAEENPNLTVIFSE